MYSRRDFYQTHRHNNMIGGVFVFFGDDGQAVAFVVQGTLTDNILTMDHYDELTLQHPSDSNSKYNYSYNIAGHMQIEARIAKVDSTGEECMVGGSIALAGDSLVLKYLDHNAPALTNAQTVILGKAQNYSFNFQGVFYHAMAPQNVVQIKPVQKRIAKNVDLDKLVTELTGDCKTYADKLKVAANDDQLAMDKLTIISRASKVLADPEKNAAEKIRLCHSILYASKLTLSMRRDSDGITLLKKIAVGVAFVLGLGIGGYVAYHSFFGSRATNGLKLIGKAAASLHKANIPGI